MERTEQTVENEIEELTNRLQSKIVSEIKVGMDEEVFMHYDKGPDNDRYDKT